jgi:probable rRNA maturation factor
MANPGSCACQRPVAVCSRHRRLRLDRRAVIRAVRLLDRNRRLLGKHGLAPDPKGELSVAFLTDAMLARLHARYFADPSPTDVITFSGDPALAAAGEICVSVDAAERAARVRRSDFSAELTLYLVHGWLHLAGHDDRQPALRRAMRRAESLALRLLCSGGSLPRFALRPRGRAARRPRPRLPRE